MDCIGCRFLKNYSGQGECWLECQHPKLDRKFYDSIITSCFEELPKESPEWCPIRHSPPIEEATDETMRFIAKLIEKQVGPNYGFMVMVFPFSQSLPGVAHYISNVSRADMIKALREKADVLEKNMDITSKNSFN